MLVLDEPVKRRSDGVLLCSVSVIIVNFFFFFLLDVFLPDSPKVPGLKFDRDTSGFWYKPSISRNDGNAICLNCIVLLGVYGK